MKTLAKLGEDVRKKWVHAVRVIGSGRRIPGCRVRRREISRLAALFFKSKSKPSVTLMPGNDLGMNPGEIVQEAGTQSGVSAEVQRPVTPHVTALHRLYQTNKHNGMPSRRSEDTAYMHGNCKSVSPRCVLSEDADGTASLEARNDMYGRVHVGLPVSVFYQ